MTTEQTPYARGYYEGYLHQQAEQAGGKPSGDSPQEAALVALRNVQGLGAEQEGEYWLGYYHGRYHARTGEPAPAAQSSLPAGPVASSAYLRTPDDIRKARQQLGLSQGQLAAKLGTTVTTISNWERGQRTPRDIGIIALALERLGWQPGQ